MAEQGWSQATVIKQGGPSTTSLTKVLSGTGNLSPRLIAQLDAGLKWEAGTAAKILRQSQIAAPDLARIDLPDISDEELVSELLRRLQSKD